MVATSQTRRWSKVEGLRKREDVPTLIWILGCGSRPFCQEAVAGCIAHRLSPQGFKMDVKDNINLGRYLSQKL